MTDHAYTENIRQATERLATEPDPSNEQISTALRVIADLLVKTNDAVERVLDKVDGPQNRILQRQMAAMVNDREPYHWGGPTPEQTAALDVIAEARDRAMRSHLPVETIYVHPDGPVAHTSSIYGIPVKTDAARVLGPDDALLLGPEGKVGALCEHVKLPPHTPGPSTLAGRYQQDLREALRQAKEARRTAESKVASLQDQINRQCDTIREYQEAAPKYGVHDGQDPISMGSTVRIGYPTPRKAQPYRVTAIDARLDRVELTLEPTYTAPRNPQAWASSATSEHGDGLTLPCVSGDGTELEVRPHIQQSQPPYLRFVMNPESGAFISHHMAPADVMRLRDHLTAVLGS